MDPKDASLAMQEEPTPPTKPIPVGIVVARILVISGIGFSAALGTFFVIAEVWQIGLPALAATLVFLILMFAIERGAG